MSKESIYKKGDRVKFISDQPSVYLSRYADNDSKIEKEEHIGIIKNIHTPFNGVYLYLIVTTTPVRWICHVYEKDIIEKLPDEYKR
ncbi:MAG: hypothetical protein IKT00_02450 [Prevotella sp.]|nr:hypothetical protein [Prevotella sp.]